MDGNKLRQLLNSLSIQLAHCSNGLITVVSPSLPLFIHSPHPPRVHLSPYHSFLSADDDRVRRKEEENEQRPREAVKEREGRQKKKGTQEAVQKDYRRKKERNPQRERREVMGLRRKEEWEMRDY